MGDGRTESVESDARPGGPDARSDQSDPVAGGRESGVNATDLLRFRADAYSGPAYVPLLDLQLHAASRG